MALSRVNSYQRALRGTDPHAPPVEDPHGSHDFDPAAWDDVSENEFAVWASVGGNEFNYAYIGAVTAAIVHADMAAIVPTGVECTVHGEVLEIFDTPTIGFSLGSAGVSGDIVSDMGGFQITVTSNYSADDNFRMFDSDPSQYSGDISLRLDKITW